MNTSSPPKKWSYLLSSSRKKPKLDLIFIEKSSWNPFERVDPKILEILHRKNEQARRYFLLTDDTEEPL